MVLVASAGKPRPRLHALSPIGLMRCFQQYSIQVSGLQAGWGKALTYVVAFNKDGVTDVMQRYTRSWPQVRERRKISSEAWFAQQIARWNAMARQGCSAAEIASLQAADAAEATELAAMHTQPLSSADLALPGAKRKHLFPLSSELLSFVCFLSLGFFLVLFQRKSSSFVKSTT